MERFPVLAALMFACVRAAIHPSFGANMLGTILLPSFAMEFAITAMFTV